jgi:hypothetical protein
MSRVIKSNELNAVQKSLILNQLKCIKDTVSVCVSRSIDDYDDVIGLLARLVSDELGYGVEEIKCSIDEQFE